jgi:uncharacterized SAM-dependent methyltransferase
VPIDISQNALIKLKKNINDELPTVTIKIRQGDYFQVLDSLKNTHQPKVVLFLGSNLGNMPDEMAPRFLHNLGVNLGTGDKLLLGVDLIKAREIVLPSYNDRKGVTAAFNLNLLERINRELGGNFNIDNFSHQPEYNEGEGIAKSFLNSKASQKVNFKNSNKIFEFSEGEKILTEISRKYNDEIICGIVTKTDLRIIDKLTDRNCYFTDYILEKQ